MTEPERQEAIEQLRLTIYRHECGKAIATMQLEQLEQGAPTEPTRDATT